MDVDMEPESDEDTEMQIKDLEQLTAVLEEDEPCASVISQYSASTLSLPCPSSKVEEYSKIETAIALNKLTDEKLLRLEKILVDRLRECRFKLSHIQNSGEQYDKIDRSRTFRYCYCGKPYFKDKNGFQPPENPDTILMEKTGMYDFSNISTVPGWTVKDKSEFITLIHQMSKEIKIKEINSQIAHLKRDAKVKNVDNDTEIAALRQEINKVNKKSLKELALPINQDYDWDTVANSFSNRHTAEEYCSIWRLFLHPSINKNSWSKAEHINLQKIAQSSNVQDWKQIACQLNTGRTEYQCFVYFRTNMASTFTNQKWTKEEEEYLKRLIEYYREGNYIPWGRVAASMENRTKIQAYNKYLRLLELRKGRFLPEEDAVILNCIEVYGNNFSKIKEFLPGRSGSQLRNRYQLLSKQRLSAVWTLAEDKKLLQMMANQDTTTNFASMSKFLPGKDRINIRSRYLTLMRWMQRNPNLDIKYAPRRGARRLCHGQATDDINRAVEKLKDRMQCEVDKKSKRITKNSTEEDIEEALIALMVTENIKEAEKRSNEDDEFALNNDKVFSVSNLNGTNLKKTLILLKAKLNKEAFKESSSCDEYPELMNPEQEVNLNQVRSYSKKKSINIIKTTKPADVWGNCNTRPSDYVMPPNLATITGCRSLIAHASSKPASSEKINPMKKRNIIYKDELRRLMERFNILFLWPMLLSNEKPSKDQKLKNTPFTGVPRNTTSRMNARNQHSLQIALSFLESDDISVIDSSEKDKDKVDET